MPKRKIYFGRGWNYDSNKTHEENWEDLRKYHYKHYGTDIGEMPPENKEDEEWIKKMMPELDKMIEEEKEKNKKSLSKK